MHIDKIFNEHHLYKGWICRDGCADFCFSFISPREYPANVTREVARSRALFDYVMSVYVKLTYRHTDSPMWKWCVYYCLSKLIEWLPALSLRLRKSGIYSGAGWSSRVSRHPLRYTNFCQVHVRLRPNVRISVKLSEISRANSALTQTSNWYPLSILSFHKFFRCKDLWKDLGKGLLFRRCIRIIDIRTILYDTIYRITFLHFCYRNSIYISRKVKLFFGKHHNLVKNSAFQFYVF